jgi:hypothetical protein
VVVVAVVSIGKKTKAQKLRTINTQGQTKRRGHFSAVPDFAISNTEHYTWAKFGLPCV